MDNDDDDDGDDHDDNRRYKHFLFGCLSILIVIVNCPPKHN